MRMNIYDYTEKRKISLRRVLDFTVSTNPLGPSNKAKGAIRKAVKSVSLFPDPLSRRFKRYISGKEHVGVEHILAGPASSQMLELLLLRLKPQTVLVPSPVPSHYSGILQRQGCQVVPFATSGEDFLLDLERFMSHLGSVDLALVPNPHPLTGALIPLSDLTHIIGRIEGSRKTMIVDEALMEFTSGESPVKEATRSGNTIILRNFSFFHALADLDIAYALGSPRLLDRVASLFDPGPVGTIATAAALASAKDEAFYRRTSEFIQQEKTYLNAKLAQAKGIHLIDTPCNFLLVQSEKQGTELAERFLERDILVETFQDRNGASFLRLPIRRHHENARFAKTLMRITAR